RGTRDHSRSSKFAIRQFQPALHTEAYTHTATVAITRPAWLASSFGISHIKNRRRTRIEQGQTRSFHSHREAVSPEPLVVTRMRPWTGLSGLLEGAAGIDQ